MADSACTPKSNEHTYTVKELTAEEFRGLLAETTTQTTQLPSLDIAKGQLALDYLMRLGKRAAVDITGRDEEANNIHTVEQAFASILRALMLGIEAKTPLKSWKVYDKASE